MTKVEQGPHTSDEEALPLMHSLQLDSRPIRQQQQQQQQQQPLLQRVRQQLRQVSPELVAIALGGLGGVS
jgi:aspartate/glutamate racemase